MKSMRSGPGPKPENNQPAEKHIVAKPAMREDRATIDALADCGTSLVSDVLGGHGLMDMGLRPILGGVRVGGSAFTVAVPPGDNLMVHVALEQLRPGDILVIAPSGPSTAALLGDLLATAAMVRGCRGAIIDGGVRDVRELSEMGFPVWSGHVSARAPTRAGLGAVNVPVVCGGVEVHPSDVIVADDDGICVVARERAASVLDDARVRGAAETERRARLLAGQLTLDLDALRPVLAAGGLKHV